MAPAQARLRAATEADRAVLLDLYGSTRAAELARVPWDDAAKRAFVEQQFTAQATHYGQVYPHASFDLIELGGEPVGRLYVDRRKTEIRIVDLTLAPEHRGAGIGTALLATLAAEADALGKRLTIHVERLNPARALYERLGFSLAEDKGVYLFLERPPRSTYANTAS